MIPCSVLWFFFFIIPYIAWTLHILWMYLHEPCKRTFLAKAFIFIILKQTFVLNNWCEFVYVYCLYKWKTTYMCMKISQPVPLDFRSCILSFSWHSLIARLVKDVLAFLNELCASWNVHFICAPSRSSHSNITYSIQPDEKEQKWLWTHHSKTVQNLKKNNTKPRAININTCLHAHDALYKCTHVSF